MYQQCQDFKEGETLHGTKIETGFGGKGSANQAVMTAKLGGKVGMLSCVGDDICTDTIKNYKDNGVGLPMFTKYSLWRQVLQLNFCK